MNPVRNGRKQTRLRRITQGQELSKTPVRIGNMKTLPEMPEFSTRVYPENIFEARSALRSKHNRKLETSTLVDLCRKIPHSPAPVDKLNIVGSSNKNALIIDLPHGKYSLIILSGRVYLHVDKETDITVVLGQDAEAIMIIKAA